VNERAAILACVAEHPLDSTPRAIAADWFEDRGEPMHAAQLRACVVSLIPVTYFRFLARGSGDGSGYGSGYGYGYGSGDGSGYGSGYGYGYGSGYGSGDGSGDGDGYGYGYGYGDGSGDGDGYGYGYGYGDGVYPTLKKGKAMPEVGKNQLIVLAHGWVICGFVEDQPGPFQFRVTNASVICRTNGVPWDELADGKRRKDATYRAWGTVTIGPQFVMSREWKGDLP